MARKLSDIANEIQKKESLFYSFLVEILDAQVLEFINELQYLGNAYLFSGIIRNYFLGIKEVRDVDIMVDTNESIDTLLSKYKHRRNSFGGYKLMINDTTIDLWYLKESWALTKTQNVIDLDLEKYIPQTSFFNFSSIVYSFNKKSFFYTKEFMRFLRDKKIDFVFGPNANYALCIVNSFYYSDKFKMSLTEKLKLFLVELTEKYSFDYEAVQLKHFGKVLYAEQIIKSRVRKFDTRPKRMNPVERRTINLSVHH